MAGWTRPLRPRRQPLEGAPAVKPPRNLAPEATPPPRGPPRACANWSQVRAGWSPPGTPEGRGDLGAAPAAATGRTRPRASRPHLAGGPGRTRDDRPRRPPLRRAARRPRTRPAAARRPARALLPGNRAARTGRAGPPPVWRAG